VNSNFQKSLSVFSVCEGARLKGRQTRYIPFGNPYNSGRGTQELPKLLIQTHQGRPRAGGSRAGSYCRCGAFLVPSVILGLIERTSVALS
jgi:hypothetical protein